MSLPANPSRPAPNPMPSSTPPQKPRVNRRMLIAGAVFGAICFFAGMGTQGDPETITVHDEGPVHTVYTTVKPPHPPEKVIEVKMPQSCLDAIAFAAGLSQNAITMTDSSSPIIDAMKEAGVALGTGDKNKMNAATEKVSKLNSGTLKAKQDYAIIYPKFIAKWQQCEKESK